GEPECVGAGARPGGACATLNGPALSRPRAEAKPYNACWADREAPPAPRLRAGPVSDWADAGCAAPRSPMAGGPRAAHRLLPAQPLARAPSRARRPQRRAEEPLYVPGHR